MTDSTTKVEREARLRWVPIPAMKVSPLGQRELNTARVDRIASNFDLEQIGTPTVNERDGAFYIIDGQHRIAALKLIGWGDQQIQCWTYVGLSEADEAERFLKLNDVLTVDGLAKYRVAVQAGRPVESDIERILRTHKLCVSREEVPGAIQAVGTLRRIYDRAGPGILSRALVTIRDAYGDAGFGARVIDGIGFLCQEYNGEIDDAAVKALADAHGGVNGLLNKAEGHRRATGNKMSHSVAAAAVEIINAHRKGRKLAKWYR